MPTLDEKTAAHLEEKYDPEMDRMDAVADRHRQYQRDHDHECGEYIQYHADRPLHGTQRQI